MLVMMVHVFRPTMEVKRRESQVQGQPQLHSKIQNSLEYMRPCLPFRTNYTEASVFSSNWKYINSRLIKIYSIFIFFILFINLFIKLILLTVVWHKTLIPAHKKQRQADVSEFNFNTSLIYIYIVNSQLDTAT